MGQICDREWIRHRLERNRPWTAYALADLEQPHFESTSWFCDAAGNGLTLLYRGYSRPIIFCIEYSENTDAILNEIDDTLDRSERYVVVDTENAAHIRMRYRTHVERPTIRMSLEAVNFRPTACDGVTRLTPGHLDAVKALYLEETPEFFQDQMLADGVYFGIFEGNDLIAVAGTHLISRRFSVAGLGNIYTRGDRRTRGHATRVTGSVSRELLDLGIGTIVLNVREENTAAIRVYSRLGFQACCRYVEIVASPG